MGVPAPTVLRPSNVIKTLTVPEIASSIVKCISVPTANDVLSENELNVIPAPWTITHVPALVSVTNALLTSETRPYNSLSSEP